MCLINLMCHLKKYHGIVPENITKPKKTLSKPFPPPKKSVHPEQFILSKCLKFEARIHCKVRLRPKKLQTSHCQCPHRRGCHCLDTHDKTWQNQGDTKESLAFDSLWRGNQAVTRSVQQVAGLQSCHWRHRRGLLHRQVSNAFRCVKPETIVQVPFKSTYLPHFLIHFDACWHFLDFGGWSESEGLPKPPLLAAAAPNKPPLLLAPQEQLFSLAWGCA